MRYATVVEKTEDYYTAYVSVHSNSNNKGQTTVS